MKKRIAILGGGMASLTTAFELTNHENWQNDYDITVYTNGWRLGGKGASGRNADAGERIEEHGLHVMFGFYDNVFRCMRETYQELGRSPTAPLSTWQDAFKPHNLIVMMEQLDGKWLPWIVDCPTNSSVPGDGAATPGPWGYVEMLLEWIAGHFHTWAENSSQGALSKTAARLGLGGDLDFIRKQVHQLAGNPQELPETASTTESLESGLWNALRSLASGTLIRDIAGQFFYLDLAHGLARSMPADAGDHEEMDHNALVWLLRKFDQWFWDLPGWDTDMRRMKISLDFAITIAVGLICDKLIFPPENWFEIDDLDFREWLKRHGAKPETIGSTLVRGLYDAVFATDAELGAGTIVHLLLRMGFTYKGSVLYKMQAGMGDTIFTPLYTVLSRRGVKFEFFACVNQLKLSADKKRVEKIEIGRQATVLNPPYRPLHEVKGLDCWASTPHYDQLKEGDELKRRGIDLEDWWADWPDVEQYTLQVDRDFDTVVFGISIGSIPFLCKDMMEDAANPRFKEMAETVKTCQTQALQLWFAPDLPRLGWPTPSPIVIPYVEPLDTWADMSQLIALEDWPAKFPVGNIAYLCSDLDDVEPIAPRSDHDYPKRQNARARQLGLDFCKNSVRGLWPLATQPGAPNTLNWWWLVDPQNRQGEARFDSQYWHAPVSPSERYVLSVPKSSWSRLGADESGYQNLVLTGDWILTPLSAGCLEAATISGLQAARAIRPDTRATIGDWKPTRHVQAIAR
ncbi:MAG TPA: NAD(P)-binding protein [Polyangia bacterium]|nr:NAD(P)-binding protein [Polyangia bacterium]